MIPTVAHTIGYYAGSFHGTPKGVILHGTRSGQSYSVAEEFAATVRFVANGTGGLGWNATIGDNTIDMHLGPTSWGWNAREHSSEYLAVEFAQARLGDQITDAQVATFAWYFLTELRRVWPDLPAVFPEHYELPAGIRDGKSDCDPAHPGLLAARCVGAIQDLSQPPSNREADLVNALAYVADDLGDRLLEIQKELQRVRVQQIGERP